MMSTELYEDIIKTIRIQSTIRNCQNALEEKYPTVSTLTLGSILNSYIQKKMKHNYSRHNSPEKVSEYYQRFLQSVENKEPPGILIRISDEVEICPVLIARVVLEGFIKDTQEKVLKESNSCNKDENQSQNSEEKLSASIIRAEINRLLRSTAAIEDKNLAYEVYLCTIHDDQYGPLPDAIKQTIGQEYEQILKDKLSEMKINYVDEGFLRVQGYDKTPDFKLEIPIAIEGKAINWIESKALFGDPETHQNYLNDQLMSYWNRFGPGLVIYWLGYSEQLENMTVSEILIRDHLPTSIIYMDTKIKQIK